MKKVHFISWLSGLGLIVLTSCNMEPTIDQVYLCNNPDYDRICGEDMQVFDPNETDTLFLSATLNHVAKGTTLSITWYYTETEVQEISKVSLTADEDMTDYPINTRLWPPADGWPLGDYKVELSLDAEGFKSIEKTFVVE